MSTFCETLLTSLTLARTDLGSTILPIMTDLTALEELVFDAIEISPSQQTGQACSEVTNLARLTLLSLSDCHGMGLKGADRSGKSCQILPRVQALTGSRHLSLRNNRLHKANLTTDLDWVKWGPLIDLDLSGNCLNSTVFDLMLSLKAVTRISLATQTPWVLIVREPIAYTIDVIDQLPNQRLLDLRQAHGYQVDYMTRTYIAAIRFKQRLKPLQVLD